MIFNTRRKLVMSAVACAFAGSANAFTFDTGTIRGNLDSTVTMGFGMRAGDPSCSRVGDPSFCPDADVFGWANSDNGNLNYRKHDFFAGYLKGNHELLANFPDDWKFLGRVSWLHDFKADDTARTELSPPAKRAIVHDERLLDLWVSKEFSVGEERARVRFGNQFINWGESLFLLGGINATNSVDLQRLSQPGTQLKEAFLPAPMISVASGLGNGFNAEAYYQFRWNRSRFAPVGGYWSLVDFYDKGRDQIYLGPDPAASAALGIPPSPSIGVADDQDPKNSGQYGFALRWQPQGTSVNLGAYVLNYHDKTPNLQFVNGQSQAQWKFLEDRKLYGVSANFPLGNWAIGSELSYRPHDGVALSGCFDPAQPGNNLALAPAAACEQFVDQKRYQFHLTGLLSLTPGDHGGFLKVLGADTATFLGEVAVIRYPDLQQVFQRTAPDGTPVSQIPAAGLWSLSNDGGATVQPLGTKTSWGYNFDFSWTYDGTVIPGWQMTPEIYFFHAVKGETPNMFANFMEGAKSANFILTFTQNPANWQVGVNYAKYWGGKTAFHQPYADRDFFGGYVSRNF